VAADSVVFVVIIKQPMVAQCFRVVYANLEILESGQKVQASAKMEQGDVRESLGRWDGHFEE